MDLIALVFISSSMITTSSMILQASLGHTGRALKDNRLVHYHLPVLFFLRLPVAV